MRKKTKAYIGIGSNLGNRRLNIENAIMLVDLIGDTCVKKSSSIYETDPVGGPPQGRFLNGVMEVETALGAPELLRSLKRIEGLLGRRKTVKNGPRAIDLDILLYGRQRIAKKDLVIPHPRMYKREFVMRGLRELKGLC